MFNFCIHKKLIHRLTILFASVFLLCTGTVSRADSPPNVLLVITDDQGYSDVGYVGNPWIKTPVLDALAKKSVVFDRFYATPICSPSRAALLTGRYAYRTGVTDTQGGYSILRPSETTIAEALKPAGYRTGLFGKWHMGDNKPARPVDQGFDTYLTHVAGMIGMSYNPQDGNSYFDSILIENGIERRFKGYCMDVFTDAAIDFVSASDEEPFFLFYAPNTPHHPLTVADEFADPYRDAGLSEQTARYYGMITNIDYNLGRIMDTLRENGQDENTIVIFVGDNGTSSLHKQEDLWEYGLRGRKSYVYENGIRVPMLIYVPTLDLQAKTLNDPAIIQDLMPTILELCGIDPLENLDGWSLVDLMQGNSNPEQWTDRPLFFQTHRGSSPVRYRHIAVIHGKHKLVQPVGRGFVDFDTSQAKYELYDLEADPFEKQDLSAQRPDIVQRFIDKYEQWFDDVCSDGFEPVATWIGDDDQDVITLTRQDWLGAGIFDGDLGVYRLMVRSQGTYRITGRWGHLLSTTHPVQLRINDRIFEREILYAESECRFDAIELEEGPVELEAWVEIDGVRSGFRYIHIEKIN